MKCCRFEGKRKEMRDGEREEVEEEAAGERENACKDRRIARDEEVEGGKIRL